MIALQTSAGDHDVTAHAFVGHKVQRIEVNPAHAGLAILLPAFFSTVMLLQQGQTTLKMRASLLWRPNHNEKHFR